MPIFFYNVYVSRCVCGNSLVIGCARVADVKLVIKTAENPLTPVHMQSLCFNQKMKMSFSTTLFK